MALLFAGGIMNMLWVVGLSIAVLAEKLLPKGEWIGKAIGIGLIGAGVADLVL
jgi:predicted metal-binding membrane protein